jgi:hypothetical protein
MRNFLKELQREGLARGMHFCRNTISRDWMFIITYVLICYLVYNC